MMNAVMVMRVAIQNGACHVKKNTAWIASQVDNVARVGRISATNVKEQKSVRGWTVKINSVRTALKRRRATVAALLGVRIVLYLTSVINGDCNKTICIDCVHSGDRGGGVCDGCGLGFCSYDCRHNIQERRKKDGESICIDCSLEGTSLH